jgi:hypothetical protein
MELAVLGEHVRQRLKISLIEVVDDRAPTCDDSVLVHLAVPPPLAMDPEGR